MSHRHTVLHTIETGGPGGAETVVLNLATRLDRSRFRSLVLLSEDRWLAAKLREQGVEPIMVDWKAWYDFRLLREMIRVIRQENVDLIHSHLPGQNFYSCVAGRLTGRKTIVTYHGPIELTQDDRARNAFKLWVVRKSAAAVVVVCDHVAQMMKHLGFPASRVTRIYNGISTDPFRSSADGKLRRELGFTNGTRLVGMVANLRQAKGYEYFVRAARNLADSFPEARFLAVGEYEPGIAQTLTRMVEELSLQDRLLFLGFRNDVPSILKDLDIFMLSSISEGVPLVLLEAMAAGKPVVVTACGGPQEVVEDGQTGFLVPPRDSESLASRVGELLAHPERATALGERARLKVEHDFSVGRMVGEYEQLYERLLGAA